MPPCKPFRQGVGAGRGRNCAERFVQQPLAGDGLQRPLRSRFQPRLKRSVRPFRLRTRETLLKQKEEIMSLEDKLAIHEVIAQYSY
jgi:chromosomal replication initiation ATPase DnaA